MNSKGLLTRDGDTGTGPSKKERLRMESVVNALEDLE